MTRDDALRIRVNATTLALAVTIVTQVVATVWVVAKVSATAESALATSDKLDRTLGRVAETVVNLDKRVGILEDRGNRAQPPSSPLVAH